MIIWSTTLLVLVTLFVPETYHPVLLRRVQRLEHPTGIGAESEKPTPQNTYTKMLLRSLSGPFVLLATQPKCLCLCIYTAILLAIIYLFFGAFELVFADLHHFSLSQVGLSFLGMLVGMVSAVLVEPFCRKVCRSTFSSSPMPDHVHRALVGVALVIELIPSSPDYTRLFTAQSGYRQGSSSLAGRSHQRYIG